MPTSLLKLILVELIGTFFLALLLGMLLLNVGTTGYLTLYLPFGIAGAVGLLAYCFQETGSSSFNPAIALGMFLVKKLTITKLVLSIVAELVGAYVGILLARYLSDAPLLAPQGFGVRAELGEFLGTALFVFAATRVALGQVPSAASGLVIGGSLFVSLSIAQAVSGGILKPALAVGLGSFHVSYLVMPLLGSIFGALLSRFLQPAVPVYS